MSDRETRHLDEQPTNQETPTMTDPTPTYVPAGQLAPAEDNPPPYLKLALPITVRELRTLLDALPGSATIGDASPFWKLVELGIYRGDPDTTPARPTR